MARTNLPDLILLDINLAEMDGYKVLEILKANVRLKNKPVIEITANAMHYDIERGKKVGFIGCLTKPLDKEVFNATLDKFIETTI